MSTEETKRQRRRRRLEYFDYGTPGYYLLTICTRGRRPALARIRDGQSVATRIGRVVLEVLRDIKIGWQDIRIDTTVIMPDHVHLLVQVYDGARDDAIVRMVQAFKSGVTRRVAGMLNPRLGPLWQVSFHDHVLRKEEDLERTRAYIRENPQRWQERYGDGRSSQRPPPTP